MCGAETLRLSRSRLQLSPLWFQQAAVAWLHPVRDSRVCSARRSERCGSGSWCYQVLQHQDKAVAENYQLVNAATSTERCYWAGACSTTYCSSRLTHTLQNLRIYAGTILATGVFGDLRRSAEVCCSMLAILFVSLASWEVL